MICGYCISFHSFFVKIRYDTKNVSFFESFRTHFFLFLTKISENLDKKKKTYHVYNMENKRFLFKFRLFFSNKVINKLTYSRKKKLNISVTSVKEGKNMSEELTRFQIQLLLYFFRSRAEKKNCYR